MQLVYRNDRPSFALGDFDGKRAYAGHDLTPRQLQVLALLVQGAPNKVIARALGISEGTVKIHLTAIFKTLRVQNRSQAAVAHVTAALRPDTASEPGGAASAAARANGRGGIASITAGAGIRRWRAFSERF
ncbi:MAG: response regulator transcription factor [Burkholderiales bacterium]